MVFVSAYGKRISMSTYKWETDEEYANHMHYDHKYEEGDFDVIDAAVKKGMWFVFDMIKPRS